LLRIYSISDSPRLRYIVKIFFDTILGIDYGIVVVPEDFDTQKINARDKVLLYGLFSPAFFSVPGEPLLFEEIINQQHPVIQTVEIPKLIFGNRGFSEYSIDFDIFSGAFYLITQYEYYQSLSFDPHGRYDENSGIAYKNGFHNQPVIDIYAAYLWKALKTKYPDIRRKENNFDYKITFDIDTPYLYRCKSLFLSFGSLFKSIVKLKVQSALQQIKTLSGGKDPYDVYDYILERIPKDKLLFFFLINRNSTHDGRHTFKNKDYRRLIRKISQAGIEVGIHPSYNSFMNRDMIVSETRELEKIIEKQVDSSRMHFLKYRLPQTFDYLQQAGISDDYTLCPIHDTGFKTFISMPYCWFDLEQNSETSLKIHPTLAMDRSLEQYMHLSPMDALDKIKKLIDITYLHNGIFTILFHNNSLSETSEWKGWKMVFENTIMYLSAKKGKI